MCRSYLWVRINPEAFLLFVSANRLPNEATVRLSPMVLQRYTSVLNLKCVFLKFISKILHVDISLISFTREDFTFMLLTFFSSDHWPGSEHLSSGRWSCIVINRWERCFGNVLPSRWASASPVSLECGTAVYSSSARSSFSGKLVCFQVMHRFRIGWINLLMRVGNPVKFLNLL